MIEIDLRSRTPMYEQVVQRIKDKIIRGELQTDEQLPSVRELSALLAINPNTIQKGFSRLEEEGFIYSVRGRGNFVMKLDAAVIKLEKEQILSDLDEVLQNCRRLNITEREVLERVKSYALEEKERREEDD
ncbi:MAG: GntR family transcriptional regulator [Vallitaleaceae bacterium]|nr:GntR family transcriptional regulator [Vallitaleaceae bacterium]